MAHTETSPEVAAYLRELDSALAHVAPDVADEIRGGIEEELLSLSPDDARDRIVQLGDARFIAAQAADEDEPVPSSSARRRSILGSRIYAVVAAVVLAVGAFLVPLVGWAFGYVLASVSPVWRRWEKVVAVAFPLGMTVLVGGFFAVAGYQGAAVAGGNPWFTLLPVVLSNAAIVLAVTNAIIGVWLLVRALVRARLSVDGF